MDFKDLSARLLQDAESLVNDWIPGGKIEGSEYVIGNLNGDSGDSCKINIRTGKWKDFATGEAGGDLISLFAAIRGIKQGEAKKELDPDTDRFKRQWREINELFQNQNQNQFTRQ